MADLDAIFYIERGKLQPQYCADILQMLWMHGAHLARDDKDVGTWPEQLQQSMSYTTQVQGANLEDIIKGFVAQHYARLSIYDRSTELRLQIDPDLVALAELRDAPTPTAEFPYGQVRLSVPSMYLHPDYSLPIEIAEKTSSSAVLLTPYQQVHYAVLNWAQVLCEYLRPAFAFSFDTNGLADNEEHFYQEVDKAFMQAVHAGRMPNIKDWIKRLEILYLPPALLTPTLLQEWLMVPDRWTRLLANGGMLSFAQPFSYNQTVANQFFEAAVKALGVNAVKQVKVNLQRARVIYESIGDSEGVYRCDALLKK
jgi:hypothetical protein